MDERTTTQSLDQKTLTELYEMYGLNEARRIIAEAKIQRIKDGLLRGATADESFLAQICIEAEKYLIQRFRIGGIIQKKEKLDDYE